ALMVAALACGPATPTAAPAPTDTTAPKPTKTLPAPTAVPEPSGGITSFRDVEQATVQIVAQGTFRDPEVGLQVNAAGAGSGFLISSDGLAVTNNHVVTGAARLKVYLEGQEYRAKLLGASECWDLAVIQLEGENFPYLELYTGDVDTGLDVYAAGFPLGDPEFTLTKGIVSKARADGESSWASVDSVIEHDATINPGNSGGPLVTADGQLVGINYAGSSSTNQYYAIKAQDAERVINDLIDSNDVDSIGINGQAIVWNDGQNSGIWVSSVKSGSPADNSGVMAGDILTTMEGLSLASQGTLTEYCDIIRSHQSADVLSIEVLRFDSQEYLAGQLNGRMLEVSYSFANELGGDVSGNTGSSTAGDYTGYTEVRDDSGAIKVEVPNEWVEIDGQALDFSGISWVAVQASNDLAGFSADYTAPGVMFAVSRDIAQVGGYIQMLDGLKSAFSEDCTYDSRNDYADSAYEGQYDVFTNCSGTDNVFIVLSARPIENQTDFLLFVLVNILTDQDLNALDQILNTFDVVGALP
ncbi:MAG: trypsin-like peptidase domain-containing protein, partial [Anaerolineales bacterium]|nr:trypsin-like peptidase domain-containing protein [Anaerolineales bacterium]